ncbi:MAG: carboxypeptidase-like regulatory domain-containing protein [Pyrinomonadaceae bacterium]
MKTYRTNPNLPLIFLLACTLLIQNLSAQDRNGVLSGVVTDPLGAVIASTRIILTDTAGKSFDVLTDSDGKYSLSVPAGIYAVRTEHTNRAWEGFTIPKYGVAPASKMSLDIVLSVDRLFPLTHGTPVMEAASPPGVDILPSNDSGEVASFLLDRLGIEAKLSKERLYVISRRGKGDTNKNIEFGRLNWAKAGRGVKNFDVTTTVLAVGDKAEGEGRLEFYLGNELRLVILAKPNKMPLLTCCPDFQPTPKRKTR